MQNENITVTCPPCGEQPLAPEGFNPGVAVATKRGFLNKKAFLTTPLPACGVLPPQGGQITARGFTLIELLVVVLIIGILAAVAVPQYQKAVEKSRAVEALSILKTTYQAAEAYYLANGHWPMSLEELDIDLPLTGTQNWYSVGWHRQGKSNLDWSIQLYDQIFDDIHRQVGVSVGRISGPYQGAGFYIFNPLSNYYTNLPVAKPVCFEYSSVYTTFPFKKEKGDYCSKIWGGIFVPTSSAINFFKLP